MERQIDPICATVMPPGADLETVRNGGSRSLSAATPGNRVDGFQAVADGQIR